METVLTPARFGMAQPLTPKRANSKQGLTTPAVSHDTVHFGNQRDSSKNLYPTLRNLALLTAKGQLEWKEVETTGEGPEVTSIEGLERKAMQATMPGGNVLLVKSFNDRSFYTDYYLVSKKPNSRAEVTKINRLQDEMVALDLLNDALNIGKQEKEHNQAIRELKREKAELLQHIESLKS